MPRSAIPTLRMATFLLLTASLALLLAGCSDEDDSRTVEPPTGGGPGYQVPDSPAAAWSNLELALTHTDAFGWEDQLAADFAYVPDPQTAQAYPTVDWASWGRAQDVEVVGDLDVAADSVAADLTDVVFHAPAGVGGMAIWDVIYDVQIWSSPRSVTRYRARALLTFEFVGADWQLTLWEDLQRESDPDEPSVIYPSLGEVRGALAP